MKSVSDIFGLVFGLMLFVYTSQCFAGDDNPGLFREWDSPPNSPAPSRFRTTPNPLKESPSKKSLFKSSDETKSAKSQDSVPMEDVPLEGSLLLPAAANSIFAQTQAIGSPLLNSSSSSSSSSSLPSSHSSSPGGSFNSPVSSPPPLSMAPKKEKRPARTRSRSASPSLYTAICHSPDPSRPVPEGVPANLQHLIHRPIPQGVGQPPANASSSNSNANAISKI